MLQPEIVPYWEHVSRWGHTGLHRDHQELYEGSHGLADSTGLYGDVTGLYSSDIRIIKVCIRVQMTTRNKPTLQPQLRNSHGPAAAPWASERTHTTIRDAIEG